MSIAPSLFPRDGGWSDPGGRPFSLLGRSQGGRGRGPPQWPAVEGSQPCTLEQCGSAIVTCWDERMGTEGPIGMWWWCGGVVVVWWWCGGGVVVWWCGGVVVWWCGGVVVWWCGGVVVWWCGGVVVWWCGGGGGGGVVVWWCGGVVVGWSGGCVVVLWRREGDAGKGVVMDSIPRI